MAGGRKTLESFGSWQYQRMEIENKKTIQKYTEN